LGGHRRCALPCWRSSIRVRHTRRTPHSGHRSWSSARGRQCG